MWLIRSYFLLELDNTIAAKAKHQLSLLKLQFSIAIRQAANGKPSDGTVLAIAG